MVVKMPETDKKLLPTAVGIITVATISILSWYGYRITATEHIATLTAQTVADLKNEVDKMDSRIDSRNRLLDERWDTSQKLRQDFSNLLQINQAQAAQSRDDLRILRAEFNNYTLADNSRYSTFIKELEAVRVKLEYLTKSPDGR